MDVYGLTAPTPRCKPQVWIEIPHETVTVIRLGIICHFRRISLHPDRTISGGVILGASWGSLNMDVYGLTAPTPCCQPQVWIEIPMKLLCSFDWALYAASAESHTTQIGQLVEELSWGQVWGL